MTDDTVNALTCKEAWELVQSNPRAMLIDIRSTMEYLFVGHPKGSVHVAWLDEPDWVQNPHFVTEVRKVMLGGIMHDEGHESAPIVLICRSGKRSLEAGRALTRAGFDQVFHVDEGFEGDLNEEHRRSTLGGWRFHNLPWEQC